jgi:quercetin dioxygenase-like cupin family protein
MEAAAAHEEPYQPGDTKHFTGEVWLQEKVLPNGTEMLEVHFSVGARTNWHMHPTGQLLVVRSGRGLVVPRDGEGQVLVPGDIVYAPPGEEHYHGAGPDSPMAHVAVIPAVTVGASATWGEEHEHGAGPDSPMAQVAVDLAVTVGVSATWGDTVSDETYREHFTEALVKWQRSSAGDH